MEQKGLHYLDTAYEIFPNRPEDDPNYLFADAGIFTLELYEGLIYLDLKKGKEAYSAFSQIEKALSTIIVLERIRLEIVNHQGRAAIMKNNLDEYVASRKAGMTGAVAIKSRKRFDEAFNIFQQDVPPAWYKKPQLKPLIEQYHLLPLN